MEVVRQSGRSKNTVSRNVPLFRGNKYDNSVTIVGSGIELVLHFVNPDTHVRSNQGPDWYHTIYYATTQKYMKAGMKIFETRGVYAVSNDIKQLHLRNTFEPLYPSILIKEEYYEVL